MDGLKVEYMKKGKIVLSNCRKTDTIMGMEKHSVGSEQSRTSFCASVPGLIILEIRM